MFGKPGRQSICHPASFVYYNDSVGETQSIIIIYLTIKIVTILCGNSTVELTLKQLIFE